MFKTIEGHAECDSFDFTITSTQLQLHGKERVGLLILYRAGNKVQNVGCLPDNQHEYFGCPPQF